MKARFAYRQQPEQVSFWRCPGQEAGALRRRFNKLSCAGWLPHFRSFVSGLPRSRSERRSEDRLITGTRVPHLALPPTLGACRMIAVFFALLSVA